MHRPLPPVTLRNGETVEAAVIQTPDPAWADRIAPMLGHKGEPWNWQNGELLRTPTGVEARFFVLHRGGAPFACIMLAETVGVGLLGHVWTDPDARRTGASSVLMEFLLADFSARAGRAIFLGTEFDGTPWHYYRRRGFEPVEPASPYLARYAQPREEFERAWFGAGQAVIEPLDWPHWPAAAPLLLGAFAGVVRLAGVQAIGRCSSEGALLPLIRESRRRRAARETDCACVLRAEGAAAVLGLASRQPHPLWPQTDLLDVYCHPQWWPRAGELIKAVSAGGAPRLVAYADTHHEAKRIQLEQAGFFVTTTLPRWVPSTAAGGERLDVSVFIKE